MTSSSAYVRLNAAAQLIQHVIDGHVPLTAVSASIIKLVAKAADEAARQEQPG